MGISVKRLITPVVVLITVLSLCIANGNSYTYCKEVIGNEALSDKPYVVVIDAGHGGKDSGTSGNGLVEKDINLDISLRLNAILKQAGINTYMIRTGDTFSNHIERIKLANSMKATLYISIHCNWYKSSRFGGIQTFYYPSDDIRAGKLIEKDYAQIIQNNLMAALKTKDRGLQPDTKLSVLWRAQMPSILIEMGFLSNKDDASLLGSENYRQKAAWALAQGIQKSLAKIA